MITKEKKLRYRQRFFSDTPETFGYYSGETM